MYNTKINSVWILRIDPYRHIKVLQIHWYTLRRYVCTFYVGNPRIDGKWILFENEAEIGKDKKRFFPSFSVINADMFLWYPLCAPCVVVKECYFRPVRECRNKFRKFISKIFFYLVVFSALFSSMCNLLWQRGLLFYIHVFLCTFSHTIKCISTSSTFWALMKINDGFFPYVHSCITTVDITGIIALLWGFGSGPLPVWMDRVGSMSRW